MMENVRIAQICAFKCLRLFVEQMAINILIFVSCQGLLVAQQIVIYSKLMMENVKKKDCPKLFRDGCSQEFVPVCAINGTTYSNICELEKASCGYGNEDLIKAYDGECKGCPDMCIEVFA